jgi:hypothetical protein
VEAELGTEERASWIHTRDGQRMQNSRKHDFASFPCKKDTMVGKHSTTELHPSPKALCCLNLKEKTPNNVPHSSCREERERIGKVEWGGRMQW